MQHFVPGLIYKQLVGIIINLVVAILLRYRFNLLHRVLLSYVAKLYSDQSISFAVVLRGLIGIRIQKLGFIDGKKQICIEF